MELKSEYVAKGLKACSAECFTQKSLDLDVSLIYLLNSKLLSHHCGTSQAVINWDQFPDLEFLDYMLDINPDEQPCTLGKILLGDIPCYLASNSILSQL